MVQVLPDIARTLRISDRYGIGGYLAEAGKLILDEDFQVDDNGTQDMASRVLKDLAELGATPECVRQAICLFYRDNPKMIDDLRHRLNGAHYLWGLESQF